MGSAGKERIHNLRGFPVLLSQFPGTDIVNSSTHSSLFWPLWQGHREHLHHQCLRLMAGNAADAEDALNTAMLRAFQGFSEQAGILVNEKAWLSRILHNVCMDFHRERRRFVEPSEVPETESLPTPVPEEVPPDELLIERERALEIRARIYALPLNLRTPFEMRFLRGMSYADIATHLRLTNCNVRKRIQLAYGILRVSMADMRYSG
ncbi:RNA polymerase sigma factor [Vitiosangium sp. GDMCC 1.1324]|uniref:RNA polymerase sigma factor n=1 Tax=Vitiosangium sp. (strain GDMCC 1.1324) TaxID=2138576 RepID=UPI000D392A3D|nr:sigma-70 family RNA polymerase sigma factor [Vitiosangium sp. GDMCC 1.1324]PTL83724.1 RNA polymerase sigma factor [Vitiosangium sp. GDMCC 1.1324]